MAELGLNAAHEQQVLSFLEFSRGKRTQSLKDVETAFSELAESRLLDDTYTSEEVKDMLDGVCAVLKADVGSDLIHNSHTSALLLRQLFQQAEQWHLKLKVDLSEIQSGELLAKIADFEQRELSSGSAAFQKHRQLEPINATGGEKLLQMEIARLKEENRKLQSRGRELEGKVTQVLSVKDKLQDDMLRRQSSPSLATTQTDTAHLQKQIAELKLQLSKDSIKEPSTDTSDELQKELETTSHKLLKVTAELEEAKKDLQRRFSETTQYNNMRKMMESKTATIQALRTQLKEMGEKET